MTDTTCIDGEDESTEYVTGALRIDWGEASADDTSDASLDDRDEASTDAAGDELAEASDPAPRIDLTDVLDQARAENDYLAEFTLTGASGEELDFSHVEFEDVTFSGCRLSACDFSAASFSSVTFQDCDLSNCRFAGSYWKASAFEGTKAIGCDFTKSMIVRTRWAKTLLRYANLYETRWDDCALSSCDLSEACLAAVRFKKTRFSDCMLVRAELVRTSLDGIDLSTCDISGIVLSETRAELRGAKVSALQAVELARLMGIEIV